jgi:predicted GNAT family N-acyltransferase
VSEEELSQLSLILLDDSHEIKPFDCGDSDLNEFLFEKAKLYKVELLATTYILENDTQTVAYYSIFNDSLKVEVESFTSKSSFKRFLSDLVSHPKRHLKSFPALKIGRLGIDQNFKGNGLGKLIINNIISDTLELNQKQGCKLITVDAYSQSLNFYERLNFEYLTEKDKDDETRQMYFDLTTLL